MEMMSTPGFGDGAHVFQRDAARSLEAHLAPQEIDGSFHVPNIHVVEQQHVGPRRRGLDRLGWLLTSTSIFRLDLIVGSLARLTISPRLIPEARSAAMWLSFISMPSER